MLKLMIMNEDEWRIFCAPDTIIFSTLASHGIPRGPYYYDSFVTEEAVAGRFRDLLSVTQRTSSTAETSEMCPAEPPFPALSWTPYVIWALSKIINFCFLLAPSSVPPTATD